MRAIDVVRRPCVTVAPDATIVRVAEFMDAAAVGTVVVVGEEGVVGIVTDRDLVCRGLARRVSRDARVDSVMSTPVVAVEADGDLHHVYRLLREHAVRRVVVTDGPTAVGVVSFDDLVMNLISDLGDLVRPVAAEVLFGQHDAPVPAVTS